MSYSLIFSAKPHCTHTITVYEPDQQDSSYRRSIKACSKLIDAIFTVKTHYAQPSRRLHIKGRRYMYISSDEYKLIRFKNY
jgi:hypothetical protein